MPDLGTPPPLPLVKKLKKLEEPVEVHENRTGEKWRTRLECSDGQRTTGPDGPPNGPDGPPNGPDGPPNGPDGPPNEPDGPPNSPGQPT